MQIDITPTTALNQNGRPARFRFKPYAKRDPDRAELEALTAVDTKNVILWVLPKAEGCGDDRAVSMSWQGATHPTKSPPTAARNTKNAQMKNPVFSDGGGVLEGRTAQYGYRNHMKGNASMKYRQVFNTPRR